MDDTDNVIFNVSSVFKSLSTLNLSLLPDSCPPPGVGEVRGRCVHTLGHGGGIQENKREKNKQNSGTGREKFDITMTYGHFTTE